MMTLGQQPYADIDPFEMAAYLQEGYRIAQPHNCPDELWVTRLCVCVGGGGGMEGGGVGDCVCVRESVYLYVC